MSCTWSQFEQGSEGWLQSRCGMLTASRNSDMTNILKDGKYSAKRENYKLELVAERLTGQPTYVFENYAMKWGTDNEPAARQAYADFTGNYVQTCGLAISDQVEFFGASPDGLVQGDGLLEIKCPTSQTFLKWVIEGVVPEQHKPQMLAQMAVTGRPWCDFVAYDPRFPAEKDLFIRRYKPRPHEIEKIFHAAREFLKEVVLLERIFMNAEMF
jgi:putative phage-type endonuclease